MSGIVSDMRAASELISSVVYETDEPPTIYSHYTITPYDVEIVGMSNDGLIQKLENGETKLIPWIVKP